MRKKITVQVNIPTDQREDLENIKGYYGVETNSDAIISHLNAHPDGIFNPFPLGVLGKGRKRRKLTHEQKDVLLRHFIDLLDDGTPKMYACDLTVEWVKEQWNIDIKYPTVYRAYRDWEIGMRNLKDLLGDYRHEIIQYCQSLLDDGLDPDEAFAKTGVMARNKYGLRIGRAQVARLWYWRNQI